MNAWVFFLISVIAAVKGDDIYQQAPLRYSVPQVPMGYVRHPVGYVSHPVGYSNHPLGYNKPPVGYANHLVGYASQPVGYANQPVAITTSSHPAPITVYSVPHVDGTYLSPPHPVSVVHGPFLAAGPTVFATPHSVTTYSIREPDMPPCRSHPPPNPSSSQPPTSPQKPSPQVAIPTPPPPTGIDAHYKIPNPLSLFNSFTPPSINAAYHTQSSKDHPPSSQNVFSIGISTPKFDDPAYGH